MQLIFVELESFNNKVLSFVLRCSHLGCRLHTASLHQAMRSNGYVKPYKALCSAVISTAVIGAFRSSLLR